VRRNVQLAGDAAAAAATAWHARWHPGSAAASNRLSLMKTGVFRNFFHTPSSLKYFMNRISATPTHRIR
jgi:hypothetical protein